MTLWRPIQADVQFEGKEGFLVAPNTQIKAPDRSLEQRMEALRKANDIRIARADLKKNITDGAILVVDLLRQPPEYIHTMKVLHLLVCHPKLGHKKAGQMLNRVRASWNKTVEGLSERQRTEIIAEIEAFDKRIEAYKGQ